MKAAPQNRQGNMVARPNITTKPAPPRNQQVRQIISQTNRTQIGQTTLAQVGSPAELRVFPYFIYRFPFSDPHFHRKFTLLAKNKPFNA